MIHANKAAQLKATLTSRMIDIKADFAYVFPLEFDIDYIAYITGVLLFLICISSCIL